MPMYSSGLLPSINLGLRTEGVRGCSHVLTKRIFLFGFKLVYQLICEVDRLNYNVSMTLVSRDSSAAVYWAYHRLYIPPFH